MSGKRHPQGAQPAAAWMLVKWPVFELRGSPGSRSPKSLALARGPHKGHSLAEVPLESVHSPLSFSSTSTIWASPDSAVPPCRGGWRHCFRARRDPPGTSNRPCEFVATSESGSLNSVLPTMLEPDDANGRQDLGGPKDPLSIWIRNPGPRTYRCHWADLSAGF